MNILSFLNEKGGNCKSSCTFNVSYELARQGKKVLIIDMDGQRANVTFFFGIQKSDNMNTIIDLMQGKASKEDTILSINDNLHIIPANENVNSISQTSKVKDFKKIVREVAADYDYCFIDVSPSPDWRQFLTLAAIDYLIVPNQPDVASLEANYGILESIETVQDGFNPNLQVLGIVFSRSESRTNLSKEVHKAAEQIAQKMNSKVFDSFIRESVAMRESVAYHKGVTETAPGTPVAKDIIDLCKEIEKEIERHGKE